MINLMPTEDKRQIRAARTNVVLLRYIIITACTFGFLLIAINFSHYLLSSIQASAENVLSENHTQVQASTQAVTQVQQLETSIGRAKTVLDGSVDYTKILTHLGALVPTGVVLSSLTLSPTSFNTPLTIQALAKTNSAATTFQSNLQASSYFTNVTMQSLTSSNTDPTYPVGASFTVTMNQGIAQ